MGIKMDAATATGADPRLLIAEMCRGFYRLGWVSGTGGGISLRRKDRIYMAPSGVQKEKIRPEDVFVLDSSGQIIEQAADPALKLSECAPLFLSAYELCEAGAVLHSHSPNVVLATLLAERVDSFLSVLRFARQEMLKGIAGHGYLDIFELPVIDNTPRECELTETLRAAIQRYPRSPAVAVRDHGIYVWGPDEVRAKTQAECIDYLCGLKLEMRRLALPDPADSASVSR
ncbi:MAG: methylthioribulose 1-phosphate dehydratase [Leptospirales bacterium]|nr:methylthioribulose 1-phosphate dehydratase [Leptospirales bacterium]